MGQFLMDYRVENLQYDLHSTLWVLGKDVHTPRVIPAEMYTLRLTTLGGHVTACSHGETCVTVVQNELNHSLQPINSRVVYARCSSPRVNVRLTECCTENVSLACSQPISTYKTAWSDYVVSTISLDQRRTLEVSRCPRFKTWVATWIERSVSSVCLSINAHY